MRSILVLMLLIVCGVARGTSIEPMPLKDMVHEATDIAVVKLESIYGRKENGQLVTDGQFRTGPGSGNTLMAKMRIIRVLKGSALRPRTVHEVPFWPMWHMHENLDAPIQGAAPMILVLKKTNAGLTPVFDPEPWIDARQERKVVALLKKIK